MPILIFVWIVPLFMNFLIFFRRIMSQSQNDTQFYSILNEYFHFNIWKLEFFVSLIFFRVFQSLELIFYCSICFGWYTSAQLSKEKKKTKNKS